MVASRKLSTDEVNALLEGLEASSSSQGGAGIDLARAVTCASFPLGQTIYLSWAIIMRFE